MLRAPAVHFAVLGALLFATDAAWQARGAGDEAARPALGVRADSAAAAGDSLARWIEDELLYREALRRGLDRDDRGVRHRLLQKIRFLEDEPGSRDDEALVRRARELGLDRDDTVIRRLLVQKMRLLHGTPPESEVRDPERLRAFWQTTRERYRQPATTSFAHVFVARRGDGSDAVPRARRLLDALDEGREGVHGAGDPFPAGRRLVGRSDAELDALFGPGFAASVAECAEDSWCGPIASPLGLHGVRVEARQPGRLPGLAEVRPQIVAAHRRALGAKRLREFVEALRRRWAVRVVARDPGVGEGNAP
jgi:hypothetical protein